MEIEKDKIIEEMQYKYNLSDTNYRNKIRKLEQSHASIENEII